MTRSVQVEVGSRTARFFSSDHAVRQALAAVRCPKQRDQRARCWLVPVDHASDVIAYLEHAMGVDVQVRSVDR